MNQLELALKVEIYSHHTVGKSIQTVTLPEHKEMVVAIGSDCAHSLIHTLAHKCGYVDEVSLEVREEISVPLVQMFLLGLYMAEKGMAKLGEPNPLPPEQIN